MLQKDENSLLLNYPLVTRNTGIILLTASTTNIIKSSNNIRKTSNLTFLVIQQNDHDLRNELLWLM